MSSTSNNQQSKIPYIAIGIIAVIVALFGVAALALQRDFWTFVGLLVALIAALFLVLAANHLWIRSRLIWETSQIKKLEIQLQNNRLMWELHAKYDQPKQITAPKTQAAIDDKFTDPARDIALRLLSATIESTDKRYGPHGTQIMTQADAGKIGIIANDWSAAVRYLSNNYDVFTIEGRGTVTQNNKTVSRIMADVAVMSLPGVTR